MRETLTKLLPHLCICEWDDATNTETVLRDMVLSKNNKLNAISVCCGMLPIANSLSCDTTQVFAFASSYISLPGTTVQLFVPKKKIDSIENVNDTNLILAFDLKEIEHLDWEKIIRLKQRTNAKGFMLVDQKGKFIYKLYDFLNIISCKLNCDLHYCAGTNDLEKLEDARRLVEKIYPDILGKFRIFISSDFFPRS